MNQANNKKARNTVRDQFGPKNGKLLTISNCMQYLGIKTIHLHAHFLCSTSTPEH